MSRFIAQVSCEEMAAKGTASKPVKKELGMDTMPKRVTGHESLGDIKLVQAATKSYITCTSPPPDGSPMLVTEITEHKSPHHAALVSSLFKEASEQNLDRAGIKALREAILASIH
eukprot:6492802-Amphidinium_carterae.2